MVGPETNVRARLRAGQLAALLARSRRSQNGWARRLGVSSAYLSQLLSGKRQYPGARVRRTLLEQLGVRFEDLFELEGGEEQRRLVHLRVGPWSVAVERRNTVFTDGDPTGAVEAMLQDLRHSIRVLRAQPTFTAVAVLTLALGIGANSAVFTLTQAVFSNAPAVGDIDSLVAIYGTVENQGAGGGNDYFPISWPNYEDLREQAATLDGVTAWSGVGVSLDRGTPQFEPVPLGSGLVSPNYFDVLGVTPLLGRGFLPDEESPPGAHAVVVLSHATWQEVFDADPQVVGTDILLNGHPFTVVGVAPRDFGGVSGLFQFDMWVPVSMHPQVASYSPFVDARRWRIFSLHGRLAEGATVEQAEADLRAIATRLEAEYPDDNRGRLVSALPLRLATLDPNQRPFYSRTRWMLNAVVGLILVIACANVANLVLARATSRSRDIALRLALGASRARVARQLVTESVLLAFLGGIVALPLARVVRDLLWANRPSSLPGSLDVGMDLGVMAFTFVVTLLSGVAFGLAPAAAATRADLARSLQQRAPVGATFGRLPLRSALVIAQVALCFVAVTGGGLFLGSLRQAANAEVGFGIDQLLIGNLGLGSLGYTQDEGLAFTDRLIEELGATPGVEAAAVAASVPLQITALQRTTIREGAAEDSAVLIPAQTVTPDYFDVIGVPLLRGRAISADDDTDSVPVIVINQTMADQLWPNEDPLGRRVRFQGEETLWEVIGVAADMRYESPTEPPQPYFFQSMRQRYAANALLVRARDPATTIDAVRAAARRIDPAVHLPNLRPATQLAEQALEAPRAAALLLSAFAALALVLAAVGIYGVLAQLVVQRRREIGVRIAVGARGADVLRLIARQSLRWAVAGGILGALIALAMGRSVDSFLYGVRATDPLTYAGTALVLIVAALLAACVPAQRASRVDPVVVLSEE